MDNLVNVEVCNLWMNFNITLLYDCNTLTVRQWQWGSRNYFYCSATILIIWIFLNRWYVFAMFIAEIQMIVH